ncbi:PREDICTED: uncharacterized protein LOC106125556 isoform X2 [Papilio xuthus]|uniref:E3 ubiquitin-protein ligase n=1 Tax=Papilio xuthus TaxID=66420 RepID=A0AAJ6ZS92_PAPXU|nr:PREDICTED: uncharacterized protein LOC106125556 isoform X2 [Papilio xuthus]
MSNRKENIKKSLGVRRFLWSSDDDDSDSQTESSGFHRPNTDPNLHAEIANANNEDLGVANSPCTLSQRAATKLERAQFFKMLNSPVRAPPRGSVLECYYDRPSEIYDECSPRNCKEVDLRKILSIQKVKRSMSSRNDRSVPSTSNVLANIEGAGRSEAPRVLVPTLSASNIIPAMLERARMLEEPQPSTSSQSTPPMTQRRLFSMVADQSDNDVEPQEMDTSMNAENDTDNVETENVDEDNVLGSQMKQERREAREVWEGEGEGEGEAEGEPEVEAEVEEEIDVGDEERPQPPPSANNETQAAPVNPIQRSVQTQVAENTPARKRRRESQEGNYITYTVQEFNQCLLRLLECPVCLEWMEPPMSQCRRGHLVCSRCRARLTACPVCRISFSSVRNRAMEGVAELLHYPCRHGCGRGPRLRRREAHEANCAARRYACFAPDCADRPLLPLKDLYTHMRYKHTTMMKIGKRQRFSVKTNTETHELWLVCADGELFQLRVDVDTRGCGLLVHVTYVGPKCNASNFTYQVTVEGRHERKIVYCRETHSDLENMTLAISRQDCFYLGLKQAHNFIRVENHNHVEKYVDFCVEVICPNTSENEESSTS